jgi:predicted nucleic acid-binding protein
MPSPGIFADTNLLLYVRDAREPAKQARAIAWHDRLWRDASGRTSAQVISEYYVNLKRDAGARMSAEQAWSDASRYLAWKPRAVDGEVLSAARAVERRYKISWWDSLIVAAAQLQGCELLLTEDLQDNGVYGTVTVRSPFTLEVREAAATYAAQPRLASPHRPRGRPRRTVRLAQGVA